MVEIFTARDALRAEKLGFMTQAEQDAFAAWDPENPAPPPATPDTLAVSALCLSGGGIRSAAFCLGVIQAFAARGMLKQFHYLSTVSGGGYIGGWLTRCIAAWEGDVARVEAHLNVYQPLPAAGTLNRANNEEPAELRSLRRYSNYLAPSPGLAATDTWAAAVLWLRNTLVNWAVFSPLFAFAAGLPVLYYALTCLSGTCSDLSIHRWDVFGGVGLISLICLGIANVQICISLPTHWKPDTGPATAGNPGFGLSAGQIFRRISLASLAWTFLAPVAVAPVLFKASPVASVHAAFWSGKAVAKNAAPVPGSPPTLGALAAQLPPPLHWLQTLLSKPLLLGHTALCLLPILLWVTYLLSFLVAASIVWRRFRPAPDTAPLDADEARKLLDQNMLAFAKNFIPWALSSLLGAMVIGGGLRLDYGHNLLWLALAGPLWINAAEIIRSAAYVAVRSGGIYSDLDREWLARIGGDKLRITTAITVLGACAILLPRLIFDQYPETYAYLNKLPALLAILGSGSIAGFLGNSATTVFTHGVKADGGFWTRDKLIKLFAALFGAFLFSFAGRAVIFIAAALDRSAAVGSLVKHFTAMATPSDSFMLLFLTLLIVVPGFLAVAFGIDLGVNLNRFSLHAVYRNRIIRAFLGTARACSPHPDMTAAELAAHQPERIPNRYTGFGPKDNMRMDDARARSPARLFHVVNTTLNCTTGQDTARAIRKGEPFTITPLHCGSGSLNDRSGAYVTTALYACGDKETGVDDARNGITLGTAITISGAAVSPNMGYNSSPFTAFLMTLFDFRLGAWLPNPGFPLPANMQDQQQRKFFERAGPRMAIPTLLQELTGQSNDTGKYIYLSDGGHFDNLGLYEMLRRRCSRIFVVDAGADEDYKYFDLGHTLEMALIDLGVQVDFAPPIACAVPKGPPGASYYGTIKYPPDKNAQLPAATGQLIYLKPWLPADAPIELLSYKQIKTDFPHEPTEDQFFTESDFESYRRLGEFLANLMMTKLPAKADLAGLFEAAFPVADKTRHFFLRKNGKKDA